MFFFFHFGNLKLCFFFSSTDSKMFRKKPVEFKNNFLKNYMQFNTDSIKNGDKILENTWETIYKISKELEQTHEQNIAAQKILLLNPNNETINQEDASLSQTFINLNAEISQILEALQDQIMDIDLWKQLFYKYILIRNYPEAKKAAMNIIQIDQNLNDPIFFY